MHKKYRTDVSTSVLLDREGSDEPRVWKSRKGAAFINKLLLLTVTIFLLGTSQAYGFQKGGGGGNDGASQSNPPTQSTIQTWIRQNAHPLQTAEPDGSLADLQPLQQMIGTASIVGLGEATHGSHEFFTMKQRLLEFLVEKMGFTMFSIEGNWSAGEEMDRYVMTGQGDAEAMLKRFRFWTWNTQEVLKLVKWVRAYDANPGHTRKVHFTGFDMQQLDAITVDRVMQYLQMVDPTYATTATSLYTGIRPEATQSYTDYDVAYYKLPLNIKQQYAEHAQQIYNHLKERQAQYEKQSSPLAFEQAFQDARVIVQYTQFWVQYEESNILPAAKFRDASMAENIAWLHTHGIGGGKMVLWAHDAHIAASMTYRTMGTILRERYQARYFPLGFSFFQGSFRALGEDQNGNLTPLQTFTVQSAEPGSYNATLGSVGIPLYLLDLRHAPAGPVSQWLDGPHDFRMIGAVYNPYDESQSYVPISLNKGFDAIIHIQKVTASVPLSRRVISNS